MAFIIQPTLHGTTAIIHTQAQHISGTFGALSVQPLRLSRAVKLGAAVEVEHTVHAVLGRALASAPVQLLPRVVVAGDVASLMHRTSHGAVATVCPTDLTKHDERCTHLIKFRTRRQKAKHVPLFRLGRGARMM
jgi:hypothetical protein